MDLAQGQKQGNLLNQEATAIIWVGDNGDLSQGGGSGIGKKWPDSGYNLKTELTSIDDGISHGVREK